MLPHLLLSSVHSHICALVCILSYLCSHLCAPSFLPRDALFHLFLFTLFGVPCRCNCFAPSERVEDVDDPDVSDSLETRGTAFPRTLLPNRTNFGVDLNKYASCGGPIMSEKTGFSHAALVWNVPARQPLKGMNRGTHLP